MRFFTTPRFINCVTILSVFITEIATDIYLPSTRCLMLEFHSTQKMVALTLSSNFAGLALSAPFYGALSDSIGRKPTVLLGLGVFALMSFACAYANSLEMLVFLRLIQGIGAGVTYPVGVAVQKDIYSGRQFAKARATMSVVCAAAPALGPVLGGYLVSFVSWHWTFISVAVAAMLVILILLLQPETLDARYRKPFCFSRMTESYRQLFRQRIFMKYAMIVGCVSSIYWSFLSGMTFLFLDHFKISEHEYPYYQLVLVCVFIGGTVVNRFLTNTRSPDALIEKTLSLSTISCFAFVLVTVILPDHPLTIITCMIPICACLGVLFPNIGLRAIEVATHAKGYASAAYTTAELLFPAIAVEIVGKMYNARAFTIVIFMMLLHIVALGIWHYYEPQQITPYIDKHT
ncbi:MAG: multidrug effflux MFS transporter [Alphaproteobacteria bacterium]|nr:MAG: multidrug effflux MFS transporter [Alphaproteobacteria bacterium]